MNKLIFEIDAISDQALQVMQAIMAREEEAKEIMEDGSGPLEIASALSDFFEIAATIESGQAMLDSDDLTEFGAYGLDLLDRMAFLVRKLEIMDHRDHISRIFPSLAVWLVRREVIIDNLEGTADGFGMLVNGLVEPQDLSAMCQVMEEVIAATSDELQMDEDQGNPWRPWRVINLNQGIAATRSLDPVLMERTFEKLSRRLPHDMPGFFADGKRQMIGQNVPDEVQAVMNRYAEKWSNSLPH